MCVKFLAGNFNPGPYPLHPTSIYTCGMTTVGTRAQICILGLKPYLIMWIRLRRSKRLDKPQNEGSHTKKVEEYNPRRLSFSNRMNVGQASTWAT